MTQRGEKRVMHVGEVEVPRIRIEAKERVIVIVNDFQTVTFLYEPEATA